MKAWIAISRSASWASRDGTSPRCIHALGQARTVGWAELVTGTPDIAVDLALEAGLLTHLATRGVYRPFTFLEVTLGEDPLGARAQDKAGVAIEHDRPSRLMIDARPPGSGWPGHGSGATLARRAESAHPCAVARPANDSITGPPHEACCDRSRPRIVGQKQPTGELHRRRIRMITSRSHRHPGGFSNGDPIERPPAFRESPEPPRSGCDGRAETDGSSLESPRGGRAPRERRDPHSARRDQP
jgi:hypothetical protein